jgi:TIR domain
MRHSQAIAPVSIFYSYAHEDEPLRRQLEKHLALLRRQGFISEWHDREILPGAEWNREIDEHLETVSIILLLISPDFLASDYCYEIEMQRALERHQSREARVIPIILRPCDWQSALFQQLQCLPRGGKSVTKWDNQDEAFQDIAQELRRIIEHFTGPRSSPVEKQQQLQRRQGLSARSITLLVCLIGLLLLGGSGIIYDVAVFQPNHLHAQATATAFANTPQGIYDRITRSNPTLYDPLIDNSQGNRWNEYSDTRGYFCHFTGGAYHAGVQPQPDIAAVGCFAQGIGSFSNFAYQAEMTIVKGDGGGGLLFRTNSKDGFGYQLQFNQNNFGFIYGSTIFRRSTTIKAKLNQTYLLTVIGRGSSMSLYINKQWIATFGDSSASSGSIGLEVYALTQFTEVVYRNVQIWDL